MFYDYLMWLDDYFRIVGLSAIKLTIQIINSPADQFTLRPLRNLYPRD